VNGFDAEDYRLSPERNKHIFQQEIVPDLLEGKASQERPTALFLISQPGSGKSRLQKEVERPLLEQGGYVDLDSDLYKPYHDDYDALMQRDDKLMTAATRADGREWMRLASEYARERNLNVIVQETAQDPSTAPG
jgi:pantothenate kinase-related protein Tda10